MTSSAFKKYPSPWSSQVVHDAEVNAVLDDALPRQFLIAADGRPVRDGQGNFVHVRIENGRPSVDAEGNPVLQPVEILPEHLDHEGRRILEVFPPGAP